MSDNYTTYAEEGKAYLQTAVNGQKRPEIFTPDIIYNILAMAIEKFVMAALISKQMMADNHTFTDLVEAAAQISPFDKDLAVNLKNLEVYQDICPVFDEYKRDPFPQEKIPLMIETAEKVQAWMNETMQ